MIVPEYWAEARVRKRVRERQVTIKRFGWSDVSEAEAQVHAESRANEAMALVEAGETLKRFEHKVPYNGADGLPIREEVVARHEDVVITRNSYGALCLNTPDVLFADVDFESAPGTPFYLFTAGLLMPIALGLGWFMASWGVLAVMVLLACMLTPLGAFALFRLYDTATGGAGRRATRRIRRFSRENPDWHLRVYRTPAGFRVLVMHRRFDPHEDDALNFFRALGTDSLYVRMCRNQACFRARVSPKPWRIGIDAHMKPRPGVWPIKPERMPDRLKWIAAYENAAREFAACRFEEKLGGDTIDPGVDNVRQLHDQYSNAESNLPIA